MTGSEPRRSPAEEAARRDKIRLLNDQFRSSFTGGRVILSRGLSEHVGGQLPSLLAHVRKYDDFDQRNDPYGEHDFGALDWEGEPVFWKIDYYDVDLLMGSPDPTEPDVTVRVLTVMFAREY